MTEKVFADINVVIYAESRHAKNAVYTVTFGRGNKAVEMKILVVLPGAPGVYPREAELKREKTIASYAKPGLTIDAAYPKPSGFVPYGANQGGILAAARNHIALAERMIEAEREGYDACIPYGMIDFGVEFARSSCNIPIVAQAQAAYCMGAMMANRFGAISYTSDSHPFLRRQASSYGFANFIAGVGAVEMTNDEMPKRRSELHDRFTAEGKRLVKEGAELIVCWGMSMSPGEFTAREFSDSIGVPVLEGLGCAVAMAQALVSTGVPPHSKVRYGNF